MHVGFILDGNRRWAKQRGLASNQGHQEGAKTLLKIVNACKKYKDIKLISVYILSSDNFKRRTPQEVSNLIDLITVTFQKNLKSLKEIKNRINFVGNLWELPKNVLEIIDKVVLETKDYQEYQLNICVNYGGQEEIVRAVNRFLSKTKDKQGQQQISKQLLENNLDTSTPLDLVIRTGGCKRFSNFLVWQSIYAEYFFLETLWPDFTPEELDECLKIYQSQKRNFGK